MVSELLEGTLHVDSKLFVTLRALLFRPGHLTREYVAGRRRSYVPPIRLYIFLSVLFFFMLAAMPGKGGAEQTPSEKEANSLHLSFYSIRAEELVGLNAQALDSLLAANQISPTPLNRYFAQKIAAIEQGGKGEFGHLMVKNFSYAMFVLMPLFAFFVYLVFRRSAVYYVRSLVYAVHLHSFLFVLLTAILLANRIAPLFPLLGIAAGWGAVYAILSLRKLLGESLPRTLAKGFALFVLYLASMFGCFVAVVLASIALF